MRDHPPWTIPLGRWGDVPVRLHLFFVFAAACTLYLSWLAGQLDRTHGVLWLAGLVMAVLVVSIALHVTGHVFAAAQLADRSHLTAPSQPLIVGPLGDLADLTRLRDPRSQLIVSLAGPAVNLLVALTCMPGILAAGDIYLAGLLSPWSPLELTTGPTWLVALKLTLWINWTLALVNLLPACPFDGGPSALALGHLLYPRASRRRVELFVERVGLFAGVALLVAAVLMRASTPVLLVPAWFTLLTIGLIVLFCSQRKPRRTATQSPSDEELFGYDFSQGYTSLERPHERVDEAEPDDGPLERWLDTRREARRQRQQQLEAEEDQQVDDILARVHECGIEGLTEEERALLQRVSSRYRTRLD